MGLREILQRNGLTQEACARGINVSLMTVGNWVRGRAVPTGTNQLHLLDFLRRYEPGLDATALASREDRPSVLESESSPEEGAA